ncbi:MAG: hypothetical protein NVSMB68_14960 [Thermoanaerobaculia bacterium]
MPQTPAAFAALLLLLAPAAYAVCPLNIRFVEDPPSIVWDNIAGAKSYEVQESFDNFVSSRNYFVQSSPFAIHRRASAAVKAYYSVIASLPSNALSVGPLVEACTEAIEVTLRPDAAFRALTRKVVVPLVGSGPGANGGRFKTALTLTATTPLQRGRIVFHPAGLAGRADDPSIAYSFGSAGEVKEFDDIVPTLGASGIGSLDIVPEEGVSDVVPAVEARLYNDTAGGTFGTSAKAILPFDYLQAPPLMLQVPAAGSQFRLNAGLRTLSAAHAKALIYGVNGRLRKVRDLDWPADFMTLGTVSQLIGEPLAEGESVSLFFDGAVIPFYTRTENRTNDPELFIAPQVRSLNVGSFVE